MRVQLGVLEIREAIEEYIRNRIPQAREILIDGSPPFAHIANVRITLMDSGENVKSELEPGLDPDCYPLLPL